MIGIFKGCQVDLEIATCWVATATVDILARNPELFLNVCRCGVDWWDDGASRRVRVLPDMDRFCGKALIFFFRRHAGSLPLSRWEDKSVAVAWQSVKTRNAWFRRAVRIGELDAA